MKMKEWYDRRARHRGFKTGDQVYIRNYAAKGEKWMPGVITEVVSRNTYRVHFGYGSRLAHTDQLKERVMPEEDVEEVVRGRKRKGSMQPVMPIAFQLMPAGGGV